MMKAQMSITSLIFAVITLIVFVAMLPAINEAISTAKTGGTMDSMTEIIIDLFPLILALTIIAGVVFYGKPQQQY
jgi:hypothetical protein